MTYTELKALVEQVEEEQDDVFGGIVVGIRFDDKLYKVGDLLPNTKDNPDREDDREFPEFGTAEYNDLPELDGTSAWDVNAWWLRDSDFSNANAFLTDHAEIIYGEVSDDDYAPDDGEILIADAKVAKILF